MLRMTLKEVAKNIGIAYSTVEKYAQEAGWTQNGKQTVLDEKQITALIEAVKQEKSSGHKANLLLEVEGLKTGMTDEFRLAMIYKQDAELMKEAAHLEHSLRLKAETKQREAEQKVNALEEHALGQEMVSHRYTKKDYQRIVALRGLIEQAEKASYGGRNTAKKV